MLSSGMVQHDTPYEYGDAELEPVGDDPPHEYQHGADMVIVDGAAMSYRRYAGDGET